MILSFWAKITLIHYSAFIFQFQRPDPAHRSPFRHHISICTIKFTTNQLYSILIKSQLQAKKRAVCAMHSINSLLTHLTIVNFNQFIPRIC